MTDIDRLILEAWQKLGPKILADPDELHKRLARRRKPIMTRPPRAWCLALRSSDRRITPAHWVITPEHAMDLDHAEHPYKPIEHEVSIRPHALRKYCRPVRTDSWGEEVADVAKELGASQQLIAAARRAGSFSERRIKGLGGKRGKPVPLIHSWSTLDPGGRAHFEKPDSLWRSLWEWLADMVPDDFEQEVIRRPVFKLMSGRQTPEDHRYKDEMQFIGWHWVCPGCKREVKKIYYPLPPRTVFDFLGCDPAVYKGRCGRASTKFLRYDVEKVEPPPASFACKRCHDINYGCRTNHITWNQVVSQLTRGMLYGFEVEKPKWYRTERKRTRIRMLNRPARRREAVFNRMKNGWTIEEIGVGLRMSRTTVTQNICHILKQEGAKNRRELAAKLGWKHEQPLNGYEKRVAGGRERERIVRGLLLEGWSYPEIGRRIGMNTDGVRQIVARVYERNGIAKGEGRVGLGRKFGVEVKRFGRWGSNNKPYQCSPPLVQGEAK